MIRRSKSYGFTKFPNMWRKQLGKVKARGTTYQVAMAILDKAQFAEWVKLPNMGLAARGISRKAKYRAVKELEKAQVILTKQSPGKSVEVKALFRE
jgi:hypothetical protein